MAQPILNDALALENTIFERVQQLEANADELNTKFVTYKTRTIETISRLTERVMWLERQLGCVPDEDRPTTKDPKPQDEAYRHPEHPGYHPVTHVAGGTIKTRYGSVSS